MAASLIGYLALACVGAGLFIATFVLGRNPVAERPTFGLKGLKRSRALEEGGLFASAEPLMRRVSGWMVGLPIPKLRQRIHPMLMHAGDYLGLTPNDFLALSLLSAVGMFCAGLLISYAGELPSFLVLFFVMLGAAMPYLQVQNEGQERFKEVNRNLPTAIDLAALCMGAGLDFPAALKQIAENLNSPVLVEEIRRILQELELGHTRRKALEGLAERVPTEAVRDFVATVVQAEEKGTPLAEVLSVQAGMLRMRRSVRAEESAAKAGVMMMGPLMCIFMCVILLLVGPFALQWMSTGIG